MIDDTRTPHTSSPSDAPDGADVPMRAAAPRVLPNATGEAQSAELAELRRLLVGAERARLDAIEERLADPITSDTLAARLPEAITLRSMHDRALAQALAPSIDSAIGESVRRRPRDFADAIFPILGPAMRKAIASALNELAGSINQALQHSVSLRGLSWRFESWRTGVPFAQVVLRHALVYRVEQVFLIHRETGLLLEQAHLPNLALPDADLVSGMLTAIRDFVADSFQQDQNAGGLRSFSVGELTVIVEPGPKALVAAVVRGQAPPDYARRLEEAVESVHAQFGSALAEFEGDTAPFGAARPLLEDCLLSVLETDRTSGTPAAWKPWAVLLGVILVALLGWRIWTGAQWRRGARALAATPGLVVIEEGTGWRTAHVRGLRDPASPDPSAVLAAAGLDTTRVTQSWEPYLSLNPALVLRRLTRAAGAGAPPDSQLSLRGDSVVVRGAVDAEWLARLARASGGRVPGVGAIVVRDVSLMLPPALSALVDSVTGERILFAPGEREPVPEAQPAIARVARLLQRLDGALAPLSARALVQLTGRTDLAGRDSTNQALSQERADILLRILMDAVSPPGGRRTPGAVTLTARGVGTSDPLTTADSTARARVNRSVSFVVRVVPDLAPGALLP